jgi:hypothetical protein
VIRVPRLRPTLLTAAAAVATVAACAAPAAHAVTPTGPSRLGVVTAGSGTLTGSGRDRVLELRGVPARSTWFVDRPYHAAGAEATKDLVPAFFGGEDGPPNAALEIDGKGGRGATVVVELTHPELRRSAHVLRFHARLLDDVPDRMASWRAGRTATPPRRFGAAPLFLDTDSQQCSVTVDVPTTSTYISDLFGDSYGGAPYFSGFSGTQGTVEQSGTLFYGCGADIQFSFTDPTVAGGAYTIDPQWSDPESGSNSTSCAVTYGPATVQCAAAPVPSSGSQISFDYAVTIAAP